MLISFVIHINHKVLCLVHTDYFINGGAYIIRRLDEQSLFLDIERRLERGLLRPFWKMGGEDTETGFLKGFSTYFVLWVFTSA